jgi:hypothetical protein
MSNPHVDHARAFMAMLRELRFPNGSEHTEGAHFDGMLECDIRDLAQGAALLIEATAKALPTVESEPEQLRVRISNLEAQNDGLRVNNAALRDAITLLSNPVQVVTTNNHTVHVAATDVPDLLVELGVGQ